MYGVCVLLAISAFATPVHCPRINSNSSGIEDCLDKSVTRRPLERYKAKGTDFLTQS
jgi:hypothetical protein